MKQLMLFIIILVTLFLGAIMGYIVGVGQSTEDGVVIDSPIL